MKRIDDASIDLVIADPPYGETSLKWDKWQKEWLAELPRILKPTGSIWMFGSMRMFVDHASDLKGLHLIQDLVWEKHNGANLHNDRFRRVHENICQLIPKGFKWEETYKAPVWVYDAIKRAVKRHNKPAHWGGLSHGQSYAVPAGGPRLERSVIRVNSCHGFAEHPTQKPVEIIQPLLKYSCPAEGVVYDPFHGSGTTGVAATLLNLKWFASEAIPEYCDIADARVDKAKTPGPLFLVKSA
jgi:site-specific DNA-methyltransferase (adenine-specific)